MICDQKIGIQQSNYFILFYLGYWEYYNRKIQMFRNQPIGKQGEGSPYKTAKFRQHVRQRSRSRSPNRSFSQPSANTSHNTSSIHSQYLWNAFQQIQIFPTICVEMLKYEQRNISDFKKSITRQKNRINSEMEGIIVEINHLLEDYRLSLLAVMDRIYQQYITKYADFKSQILQINRLKDQIQGQLVVKEAVNMPWSKTQNLSNQHTIKSMQIGKSQLKRYQIINYIAEMQKQKVLPLTEKAEYLMIVTEYDNGFFQPQEFKNYMNTLKNGLRQNLHQYLDEVFGYIRDPDNIVFKQTKRSKQQNKILTDLDRERQREVPNPSAEYNISNASGVRNPNYPSMRRLNSQNTNNYYANVSLGDHPPQTHTSIAHPVSKLQIPTSQPQIYDENTQQRSFDQQARSQPYLYNRDADVQQQIRFQYSQQNIKTKPSPLSFRNQPMFHNQDRQPHSSSNRNYQTIFHSQHSYSHSQVIVSPYKISSDLIRISEQSPFSFKSKSMDIILCCLYIDENVIAVGSRDGSLLFYDRNGNVIKAHQNVHKSPVCTLQLVNDGQYLASGSDHPNPQIILWHLNSFDFVPYCKLREHKGAVTAIQCLQDNEHMISGSYDKKLCVYSINERKLKYTLPSNKNSVTALTLNNTGMKLISCCLQNNAINIWQIVRNRNLQGINKVDTIFLQQVVENNTMICALVSSATRPNLIYLGTKDGKLKVVDIQKGESIKTMNCCNNAVIEMLIIEQGEGLPMILCWPCKQKCYKIVDCESGRVLNVNTRGQLDFSCGVGPKATGTKDGSGFVVCSQAQDRQVYWYKINRAL